METIILFAPLVGALLCGFGWRIFGETAAMWIEQAFCFWRLPCPGWFS